MNTRILNAGDRLPNGEYHCKWTCPRCGSHQHDSVHPVDGPWITCCCSDCGGGFDDTQLDEQSLASFEAARCAAEADERHIK